MLSIENQEHDLRSMTQRYQTQDFDKNIFMLQMSSIYFDRNQQKNLSARKPDH